MTFTNPKNYNKSFPLQENLKESRCNAWQNSAKPRPVKVSSAKTITVDDLFRVCDMLDSRLSENSEIAIKENEALRLHEKSKMRIRHWKGTKDEQMKRIFEERKKRIEKQEAERVALDEAYEKERKIETANFLAQKRFLQLAQAPESRELTSQLILEHVLKEREIQIECKKKNVKLEPTVLEDPFLSPSPTEPICPVPSTTQYLELQKKDQEKKDQLKKQKEEEKKALDLMKTMCGDTLEKEAESKREKQMQLRKVLDEQIAMQEDIRNEELKEDEEMEELCIKWKKVYETRGVQREKLELQRRKELDRTRKLIVETELINQSNQRKDILIGEGNSLFMRDKQSERVASNIKSRHAYNPKEEYNKMLERHRNLHSKQQQEKMSERKELEKQIEMAEREKLQKLQDIKNKRAEIARFQLNQIKEKKNREEQEKSRCTPISVIGVKFSPLEMQQHLNLTKQLTQRCFEN